MLSTRMQYHKLALNPATHISHLPYSFFSTDLWNENQINQKTESKAVHYNYNTPENNKNPKTYSHAETQRSINRVLKNATKNTIIDHMFTLLTAKVI